MKPADAERIRQTIVRNAAEISQLHRRTRETFAIRNQGSAAHEAWERACAAFHQRYDGLAFPGGYERALALLAGGDPDTLETAICFLEVKPNFFHSGIIYQQLLRLCKKADLRHDLKLRLHAITDRPTAWREKKHRERRKSA
jgi:hypothetical protein